MAIAASKSDSVGVAVVGLGYWGPNLARNFDELEGADLRWLCDLDQERLERWSASFPLAGASSDLDKVLSDTNVDAVVVATDVPSHAEIARAVIEAGKHCFVEKPLAQTVEQAQAVEATARQHGVTLMVGHLLVYHPGVEKLKQLATDGELGDIYYIYSNRLNLGKLRSDENALWSLGAHDVSVLLHLLEEEPGQASAAGFSYVRQGVEDVVFCHLKFASGVSAHLHLSWLDPHKTRKFTVVGSNKMATFDDMELERKIVIYDKGFDRDFSTYGEYITRSGDIYSPRISNQEPLKIECRHFVECVREGKRPRSAGEEGLAVVRTLAALQESIQSDGSPVELMAAEGR